MPRARIRRAGPGFLAAQLLACAGSAPSPVAPRPADRPPGVFVASDASATALREPALPPQLAMLAGLLPLRTIGADTFRLRHPTADGRGVLIGILDSGVDAGVPGLRRTSGGQPKLLDVRDFSGEGRVRLTPAQPRRDGSLMIDGQVLTGFGRAAGLARPPYFAGLFREIALGDSLAADVDGNGRMTDVFPIVVAKGASGWFVMSDTDGDGSLANERPVHDYAVAGETFTYRSGPVADAGPLTFAVNLAEEHGRPLLDLFFDNQGHGTHVAGIAAGHNLFDIEGFDGLAPGAHLLALKISNNARGGISVTGSMLRAMNYAADFAQRRAMPLVLNLSFGVGNEVEGGAAIDSLIDEFALKHPDVLFVISAGNDGPGISTLGFPGSAAYALSVCALFPGAFARPPQPGVTPAPDVMGWWSARGGEVAKPDVCAPGVAYSTVPPWYTGNEISGGTSMAAPQMSGAAAVLLSALRQQGRRVRAIDLKQALRASATPMPNASVLDAGAGVPNLMAAYLWLLAAHQTGVYAVRAVPDGGTGGAGTAAYRRQGLASPSDTIQRFVIASVAGQPAARFLLASDADWLRAPRIVEPGGGPVTVTLTYDAAMLRKPGLYVATAWARPATDTIAGPSFGLTNTVIVPHQLQAPLEVRGRLGPGEISRSFLAVPEGAGGLALELEVPSTAAPASLYLFEPSGRPYRGRNSVSVGGRDSSRASLVVSADDLEAGVYEAVVVAAPADPVRFTLRAAVPVVTVSAIEGGPAATVRNTADTGIAVTVSAALVGTLNERHVSGTGSSPVLLQATPPPWAAGMVVEVALPVSLWTQLTDFGVTVFDAEGRKIKDGPLNYAVGRLELELDSTRSGRPLTVELFPGFAHLEAPASWSAHVRVAFVRREPVPLTVPGESSAARLILPPASAGRVRFAAAPADSVPDGDGTPLIEVRAEVWPGVGSVRRGTAGSGR